MKKPSNVRENSKKNLKPIRTSEEAKRRGQKGGRKSAETKRQNKTMRQAAKFLMDLPVSYESVKEAMSQLAIAPDDMTNQMALVVSMFKQAMNGNVRAASFIKELIGDDRLEQERIEIAALEKKKTELEIERLQQQISEEAHTGDGMPVIINVRPDRMQ